jgi:hypothetical protein
MAGLLRSADSPFFPGPSWVTFLGMRRCAVGLTLVVLLGCSAADPSSSCSGTQNTPPSGCDTGATARCSCNDGTSGQTKCGSDHKFGACACEAPMVTCSATPTNAFSGSQACLDPGQLGAFVIDWLVSFWGTQPTSVCVYDSQTGALFTGGCGPTKPDNAAFCPADHFVSWMLPSSTQKLPNTATLRPRS